MVGACCAVLANVAVIALVREGLGDLQASALAFAPVLVIGYTLHSLFTFRARPSADSFLRYTLATLANFPLWAAALYLLGDLLHVPITVAAPVTTVMMFLWNYLAARWAFIRTRVERRAS
jgi:putative flippase GtrA